MTEHQTISLSVEGMSCASCVGRVEKGLLAVDGLTNVSVNLASETARFQIGEPEDVTKAVQALRELGYPARQADVVFNVASMSCASCVGRVDLAFQAVPGVVDVNVNLASETAKVTYLQGVTDTAALMRAATEAHHQQEEPRPNKEINQRFHFRSFLHSCLPDRPWVLVLPQSGPKLRASVRCRQVHDPEWPVRGSSRRRSLGQFS